MTARTHHLPYGVGSRGSGRWYALVVALLVLVGLGLFAYSLQLTEGHAVTGLRNIGNTGGATWGLYITFVIYFVGLSFAGISVAALIRLLNLDHLKPVSRLAEALTVIALILAGLSILPDLGQPMRGVVNLFRYARPQSPFFGTFTLVIAGYLFASLVYLYLGGRRDAAILARFPSRLQGFHRLWAAGYGDTTAERLRHRRASFWLAVGILPLLITAHSTLGFVFGLQVGRPGWFGSLQAPGFVTLAGVSGVGMLIILATIVRHTLGLEDRLTLPVFRWMANLLMALLAAYLYFMVVEWLTTNYAAREGEAVVSATILSGQYAWLFWSAVAMLGFSFVALFLQSVSGRFSLRLAVFCGVLVNVAAIFKRYLIVVPSQTHGAFLPYESGTYSPNWVEYAVIVGLFALGALLLALFIRVFPIMDIVEPTEGG